MRESTFSQGKKGNYEITFTNNAIEIEPAALTITASASKEYDGEPLNGSDAVSIEGLVEGDSITVTATGTITNAGTADNPYTIDWGDTNPNNYTVTQEPGTLEVTPKEVTISTGSDEKVYDGETLFYDSYELSPSDPWVNGQAPKITVTGSITNAGSSPNTCMVEWKGVNPNNYSVTQEYGTLTVRPVEIVLISDCAYEVAGDIIIDSHGLKVQVNNVDSSYYNVYETDENEWQITFAWGDKIYASTLLIKDDTGFWITPYHYFISGDSDNYEYSTVDQEGKFDVPPVAPESEDGDGNKMFSTFSSPDRRLPETPSEKEDPNAADKSEDDDGKQDSDEEKSAVNDPAEPAPAELMSEEDTKEEDREEEAQEEEEQEKPSEEILQEELSEEKPSEDQNIDGC